MFLPGGFEEASLTAFNRDKIFIRKRKGFVKYSLIYGYSIYPVFAFNESNLFRTFDGYYSFRIWLNKFKIPAIFYYGKYGYPFAPD